MQKSAIPAQFEPSAKTDASSLLFFLSLMEQTTGGSVSTVAQVPSPSILTAYFDTDFLKSGVTRRSERWVERYRLETQVLPKWISKKTGPLNPQLLWVVFHFPSRTDVYIYGSRGGELRLCGSAAVGTSAGCLPPCDAVTPHRREFTARRAFPAERRDDGKRKQRERCKRAADKQNRSSGTGSGEWTGGWRRWLGRVRSEKTHTGA